MNINSIFQNLKTSLETIDKSRKVERPSSLPIPILKRLEVLSLLSSEVLSSSDIQLNQLIHLLNQPSINYEQCKSLYIKAYIEDFKEIERDYFLYHFLEHFDPQNEIIQLNTLNFQERSLLWENIIRYLCENYIGFPAEPKSLTAIFNSGPLSQEKNLEDRFDQGMDLLLDFSHSTIQPIEIKILFFSYLARLISKLEETEHNTIEFEVPSLELQDLFEELYYYLLNFPYTKVTQSTLFSLMKEDINFLSQKTLKQSFIQNLCSLFNQKSLETKKIELLTEILNESQFLNFTV